MDSESITITVIGTPGPQGSKRHVGGGRMVESSKKVKPWREAVVWAAREVGGKIVGPLWAEMVFTLPKPKSAPKTRRTLPDRKPDIDKLVRSTCDALTTAGVYEDDARIVSLTASKVFPGEGIDALDVPGCVIHLRAVAA
jgi:Holliday junction resolvase RusA-like endonuclease